MKFDPIQVTLTIKPQDLYDITQMIIDDLEDSFGCDVMEAAGVNEQELFDAIMLDDTFREMVVDAIKEDGFDVVRSPYDYFSGYDFLETVPGLMRVVQLCKVVDEYFQDASQESEVNCIPVPKGYKLVPI